MELYEFPGPGWQGKTPLDYENGGDGKRKGLAYPPAGIVKHDLTRGIGGAVMPPLAVWDKGKFFGELGDDAQKSLGPYLPDKTEHYHAFVVTGEYTPGNYIARIYILPRAHADTVYPDHPKTWSDFHQKGSAVTSYGMPPANRSWSNNPSTRMGFQQPTPGPATSVAPPIKSTEAKVPAKVRVRCGGCGHWWKMDDMKAHVEYCCPGINKDSDWAFECECCDTLDEVQTCKPGFPRPKPKVVAKAKEKTEEKAEPEAVKPEAETPQGTQDA